MRNGNWHRLSRLEKGLYRCALELARSRGTIVNAKLLVLLRDIIKKLLATFRTHILRVGERRAKELARTFLEQGVFAWAPETRAWLAYPGTAFYLGVMKLFG